jgi:hypothetical protein
MPPPAATRAATRAAPLHGTLHGTPRPSPSPSPSPSRPAPARAGRPGSAASRAGSRFGFLLPVFVLCLIVPVSFKLGDLRLTPYRLFLLLALLPLAIAWLTGAAGRIRLPDLLVLAYTLWCALSILLWHPSKFVEPAGILIIESFGAYLVGRLAVRSSADLARLARALFLVLLLVLPFAIVETGSGAPAYLRLFEAFGEVYDDVQNEPRLGLERVQGPFEHPILFGIFASTAFALAFYTSGGFAGLFRNLRGTLVQALSGILTFLSLSTGPLLALLIQIGLIGWDWLFRRNPKRWRNLILLVVAGYVTVDLLSNRTPFEVFVSYATFNTSTAFNRVLIWEYGTQNVLRSPFIGIGFNPWQRPYWMPASIDNFWLVVAIRHGLPAIGFLLAAFALAILRAALRKGLDAADAAARTGLLTVLVATCVAIASVHLWNATYCWFLFLLGATGWAADAPPGTSAAPAAGPEPERDRAAPQTPGQPRAWLS